MDKVFGICGKNKCKREVPGIDAFNGVSKDVKTLQEQIHYVKRGPYNFTVSAFNEESSLTLQIEDVPKGYDILSVQPVSTGNSGTWFTKISVYDPGVKGSDSSRIVRVGVSYYNTRTLDCSIYVIVTYAKVS